MKFQVYLSVLMFVTCFWTTLSVTNKCSRLMSKIPVHRNFDANRFLGTWYTVSRTTAVWGENTFESGTITIAKNPDSTLAYSYTGKLGTKCLPVETGVLEPGKRLGEFTMKGSMSTDPQMVVSFTDYRDIALVYFCFKFRGIKNSVCRPEGGQVEIMVRSESAMDKVAAYTARAQKRLCASNMEPTPLGECEVPEIMEAARIETIEANNSAPVSTSENNCVVNNISIQANFNISQMSGLWYEIARTRYTFNKMENIVSYHTYDPEHDRIDSYYTGTMPSNESAEDTCVTPLKGTSKPKSADGPHGDLLGRIGGDDSAYPWSPMKVLYADDNYLMFYACYNGQTDEPCQQQGVEVSIMGRSYDLDTESRDKLYDLLPQVCTDPEDLLVNQVTANCSSDVVHAREEENRCMLKDITVYDDYIKEELHGRWYLYAYITNATAALFGVVMEINVAVETPVEPVETTLIAFSDEHGQQEQCRQYNSRQRERCLDSANRITTVPFYETNNFVFSKILHLDNNLLIDYVCTRLNTAGYCDEDGVIFNVYKNISMATDAEDDELELELINNLAESVCLDPEQLEFETDWCSEDLIVSQEYLGDTSECDIDSISIFSDVEEFNQEDLHGYWYLLLRSNGTDELEDMDSMVAHFSSMDNETLTIHYTGCYNESSCEEVRTASLLARCPLEPNGDYLLRYNTTEYAVVYAPFKVMYLEKDNVLTTYVCQHVLPDGRCHESGGQVRIWGRNTSIPEYMTDVATDMVAWACLDPTEEGFILPVSQNISANSTESLENYVTNNVQLEITPEPTEEEGEDSENTSEEPEDEELQKDQTPTDNDDDDLEFELLMDDDEFYYGS